MNIVQPIEIFNFEEKKTTLQNNGEIFSKIKS